MQRRVTSAPRRPWRITPKPERIARPPLRATLLELAMVSIVTFAYFLTRGLIRGREDDAMRHAMQLLNLERTLHLDPEHWLQRLALNHQWLMQFANNFYLYAHLPVLVGTAVWLYIKRPWAYPWFRNAFLLSALIGLSVYVLLPLAPPRFLPGFTDTMALYGFNVDGSAAGPLYNPYAAMPSLHVGWSLLAGIALFGCGRAWWLRASGVALPVLMTLFVMMTGNHYLLDAVAGCTVVLIALTLSTLWSSWTTARAAHLRPSPVAATVSRR
jgi:hypothetical protein